MTAERGRDRLKEALNAALGAEIEQLLALIALPSDHPDGLNIAIPRPSEIDNDPVRLGDQVAETANTYARCARLSGIAKAEYRLAQGRYNEAFKKALKNNGANPDARKAIATENTAELKEYLDLVYAAVELTSSAEAAARIASESARKLYDKARDIQTADGRYASVHH